MSALNSWKHEYDFHDTTLISTVAKIIEDDTFVYQESESQRAVFPEHLPLADIQRGIKAGKFLQGSFQASRENYLEAFVNVHDQEQQVRSWVSLVYCFYLFIFSIVIVTIDLGSV